MIRLKSVFSDHALFTSSSSLTVSGRSLPGADIFFVLTDCRGGDVFTALVKADGDGRFSVKFDTPAASFDAYSFRLTENGENAVTVNDVLFGELWLASGQSNIIPAKTTRGSSRRSTA